MPPAAHFSSSSRQAMNCPSGSMVKSLICTPFFRHCSIFFPYIVRKVDSPKAIPSMQYFAFSIFGSASAFLSARVLYIFSTFHSSNSDTVFRSIKKSCNKITRPEAINEQPMLSQGILAESPITQRRKPRTIITSAANNDFQLYVSFICYTSISPFISFGSRQLQASLSRAFCVSSVPIRANIGSVIA